MAVSSTTARSQPFAQVLQDAQAAPDYLSKNSTSLATFPLSLLGGQTESTELWNSYEKLLISCLQSGDEKSAHMCLERLIDRFGPDNERIMALKGLYQEAIAKNNQELEKILQDYHTTLTSDTVNIPIAKRRITLLKSLSRQGDAIKALVELLEYSPSDAEAWMELAELYLVSGLFDRAVFCLEEVLLITPNAWNIHARLGEVLYMAATADTAKDGRDTTELLRTSVQRFCRSIELCDDYLRGYYGLKLATATLLARATTQTDVSTKSIQELNDKATKTLRHLVDQKSDVYSQSELSAAQILLESKA